MQAYQLGPCHIHSITARDPAFADYRQLRQQIFGQELGWPLQDIEAEQHKLDEHAWFMLAYDDDGQCIGGGRGITLQDGFPHAELFVEEKDLLQPAHAWVALNSLMVVPSYRGRSLLDEDAAKASWTVTLGRCLCLDLLLEAAERGCAACLLTAIDGRSAGMFARLGFHRLGQAFHLPGISYRLYNMLGSLDRSSGLGQNLQAHSQRRGQAPVSLDIDAQLRAAIDARLARPE